MGNALEIQAEGSLYGIVVLGMNEFEDMATNGEIRFVSQAPRAFTDKEQDAIGPIGNDDVPNMFDEGLEPGLVSGRALR
jgi:hypothetical protein